MMRKDVVSLVAIGWLILIGCNIGSSADPQNGPAAWVDIPFENTSGQVLQSVRLKSFFDGEFVVRASVPLLAPGQTAQAGFLLEPGGTIRRFDGQSLVEFTETDGRTRGIGSNLLQVDVRCPVVLRPSEGDPNPEPSSVDFGGAFCRHYQVYDYANSKAVPGAPVDTGGGFGLVVAGICGGVGDEGGCFGIASADGADLDIRCFNTVPPLGGVTIVLCLVCLHTVFALVGSRDGCFVLFLGECCF